MGALTSTQTGNGKTPADHAGDFRRLWRRTVRNEILGSAISVLPAMIFYDAAFSYTAAQFKILLIIAPLPVLAFLVVDLALNWWYLSPFRRMSRMEPGATEYALVYTRLHNLSLFSFMRVFGPHALTPALPRNSGSFTPTHTGVWGCPAAITGSTGS